MLLCCKITNATEKGTEKQTDWQIHKQIVHVHKIANQLADQPTKQQTVDRQTHQPWQPENEMQNKDT